MGSDSASQMARVTQKHKGEFMAIVLDNDIRSMARIEDVIHDSGVISGRFTQEEASDLAIILRAGAFPGIIADLALISNMIVVFGIMMAFGQDFTLTLPGIAGLILTIGMAVDSNVIIFERVKEELATGKTLRAAVDTGFKNATSTILDANITTFITALILFFLGEGPIKGFATTLMIGIASSVFAALVTSRTIFDIITSIQSVRKMKF